MGQFEYKDGILFVCGEEAADSTRAVIAGLSDCIGKDIGETCGLLNQLLQFFNMLVGRLQDVLQASAEVSQDICGPCRHRGATRGGMKQATPKQEKANIK